jgi:hypothetical protein
MFHVLFCILRCENLTAVAMENDVFWDINTQFVPHRKHIISPLKSPAGYCYVRFKVLKAVTMKNAIFWDIKPQVLLHRKYITSPLQSPAG